MSHKMQKQHFIYCTKLVLVILHDYEHILLLVYYYHI